MLGQSVIEFQLIGQHKLAAASGWCTYSRRESCFSAQVTIATAMAGRGTDILLGGNPKLLTQMALESKLLPVLASGELAGPVG